MRLGTRIADRMKELGLTQVGLARKSELTQQVISQYIRGKSLPGYKAIAALMAALEVTPEWFFDADECVARPNANSDLAKDVEDLKQRTGNLEERVDDLGQKMDSVTNRERTE